MVAAVFALVCLAGQSTSLVKAPDELLGDIPIGLTDDGRVLLHDAGWEVLEWNTRNGKITPKPNLTMGKVLGDGSVLRGMGAVWDRTSPPAFLLDSQGNKQTLPELFQPAGYDNGKFYGDVATDKTLTSSQPAIYTKKGLQYLSKLEIPGAKCVGGQAVSSWISGTIGFLSFAKGGSSSVLKPVYWNQAGVAKFLPFPSSVSYTAMKVKPGSSAFVNVVDGSKNRSGLLSQTKFRLLPIPMDYDESTITDVDGDIAVGSVSKGDKSKACVWINGNYVDLDTHLGIKGMKLVGASFINRKKGILCVINDSNMNAVYVLVRF